MVGQILPINPHTIAVTNYSKVLHKGNKITLLDINQNKTVKEISAQNNVESLNIINDNQFVSTDNFKDTAEILDTDGTKTNLVKIPYQVFKIVKPFK